MKIAFRADASSLIGTGHFMRCLTLADVLKQRGSEIRFISRDLPMYLREMLLVKGLEFAALDSRTGALDASDLVHADWLNASQCVDAEASRQVLYGQDWDWLVVDHYALDSRWETAFRQSAMNILVIDDIADRQHDCDVLLDQNYYADMETRYTAKVPAHCRQLLGPRYALLRDEFRQLRDRIKSRTGPVKRVLIFFGGVDKDNFTSLAIEALSSLEGVGLHVDVVIGAQHPYRGEIETACAARQYTLHVQTSRMAELMAEADLAVGAGGSATWERCCLGLPCIVITVAQNQVEAARDISTYGAVKYVGTAEEVSKEKLAQAIEISLAHDWVKMASKCGIELVDAQGAYRVAKIMEAVYDTRRNS